MLEFDIDMENFARIKVLRTICERLEGVSALLWEGLTSLEDYHKDINAGDEPAEGIPDKGFFTLKTPTTNAATPKQED